MVNKGIVHRTSRILLVLARHATASAKQQTIVETALVRSVEAAEVLERYGSRGVFDVIVRLSDVNRLVQETTQLQQSGESSALLCQEYSSYKPARYRRGKRQVPHDLAGCVTNVKGAEIGPDAPARTGCHSVRGRTVTRLRAIDIDGWHAINMQAKQQTLFYPGKGTPSVFIEGHLLMLCEIGKQEVSFGIFQQLVVLPRQQQAHMCCCSIRRACPRATLELHGVCRC